jgi:hypothetical protein
MMVNSIKKHRYLFCILLIIFLNTSVPARATDFDVDEIITAIKHEIQAVRAMGTGKPEFEIDSVDVHLMVISGETDRRGIFLRIAGFSYEDLDDHINSKPYHKLKFSFTPSYPKSIPHDASYGLVEPIKKIQSSLVKAYNNPPLFHINKFKFELEFAIEKTPDGGIQFQVINLKDLKSIKIATHKIYIHMSTKD